MKRMITLLSLTLVLLLTTRTSHAQIRIGVHGGLSIPDLRGGNNVISEGYTSRLAPNFGLSVEFPVGGHFSIEPQVNFDGQGGQRTGMQPITSASTSLPPLASGGYYYANFNNTSILNYLEIPVLAKYTFGLGLISFNIDAGPYVGFLLNATQKTSGSSVIYVDSKGDPLVIPNGSGGYIPLPAQSFDASSNVTSSLHTANFGIDGGIGIMLPVGSLSDISLNVHGLYGITVIQKSAADGTSHTGNLIISIGYSYKLPII